MKEQVKAVTIAALLHDIGKIVRRGNPGAGDHSRASLDFLANQKIRIHQKDLVLEMIANHHQSRLLSSKLPAGHPAYLLCEADNIASGADRRGDGEPGTDELAPLASVFNVLNPGRKGESKVFRPDGTFGERTAFPTPQRGPLSRSDYQAALRQLEAQLAAVDWALESPESILKILEMLSEDLPSNTYKDFADISLYDHSKLTAALAGAMLLHLQERGETDYKKAFLDNRIESRKREMFLLASADFSGIQDFIYTVSSKGAMKSLRGRSFYLELLCENVVDEILEAVGLTRANLIYSGGGHFYLLLPNTEEAVRVLEKASERVNDWLMDRFSVNLYMALAWTPASADDLAGGMGEKAKKENRVGEVFQKVSSRISRGKLNRYTEEQLAALTDPASVLNSLKDAARECTICGASARLAEADSICEDCRAFQALGKAMAYLGKDSGKDKVLVVLENKDKAEDGMAVSLPGADGNTVWLGVSGRDSAEALIEEGIVRRVYSINRFLTGQSLANNLWIGNYNTPSEERGTLIEFSELADRAKGIRRLAVLRADVDNLGSTFISGFHNPEDSESPWRFSSLSRHAVLSRRLSEFFKKYINELPLCQNGPAAPLQIAGGLTPRDLVTVYSGGDDLFVIGTWNDVVGFACDLREAFRLYTGNKLTFSAGIGLFRPGHPVSHMAEEAGRLESAAKQRPGGQKDAVALFGMDEDFGGEEAFRESHVYSWETFLDDVMGEKHAGLKKWFYFDEEAPEPGRLYAGKSFLYTLMGLVRSRLRENGTIDIARFAYLLGRRDPKNESGAEARTWREAKQRLFDWIRDPEEAGKLLTALVLVIYENRE